MAWNDDEENEADLNEGKAPRPDDADLSDEPAEVPCPYCKREISEDAARCPFCGCYLSEGAAPPARRPWWWIVAVVLLVLLILRYVLRW